MRLHSSVVVVVALAGCGNAALDNSDAKSELAMCWSEPTPCGGALEGAWKTAAHCGDEVGRVSWCPSWEDKTTQRPSTFWIFHDDGRLTYKHSGVEIRQRSFDRSCFDDLEKCNDVFGPGGPDDPNTPDDEGFADTVMCSTSGTLCVCTWKNGFDGESETTSPFWTSDTTLSIGSENDDEAPTDFSYCVMGDELMLLNSAGDSLLLLQRCPPSGC
jgi:hypothetical protein